MRGLRVKAVPVGVQLLGWLLASMPAFAQAGPDDEPGGPAPGPSGQAPPGPDPGAPSEVPAQQTEGESESVPPAGTDSLEAEEQAIAAELAAMQQQGADASAPPAAAAARAPMGLSNDLNPAISANGLVLAGGASDEARREGDLETGIHVQEVELRFSAYVDPYFRADLTLAAHEEEVGFEEAYVSTLALPYVTLRAGQMFANFGRHNLLHTHTFPFVTAPLPSRALLGEEGLRDPGVSADVLIPLPFYVEVNAQVFRGEWAPFEGEIEDDPTTAADESVPDQRELEDFVYVGHLKTLFELGEDATLELGGSYAGGRNGFDRRSDVAGVDLTVKWRPLEAERYTGVSWSSEYIFVRRRGAPAGEQLGGAFTGLRAQLHQRFWVQARGALLGLPRDESARVWRLESLLAFVPSEFSALRLQYAFEHGEEAALEDVHELFAQAIFSIGPHPPHDY